MKERQNEQAQSNSNTSASQICTCVESSVEGGCVEGCSVGMVVGVLHVLDADGGAGFDLVVVLGLVVITSDNLVLPAHLIAILVLDHVVLARYPAIVLRVVARGGSRPCYGRLTRVTGGGGDWGSDSSRPRGCRLPVG